MLEPLTILITAVGCPGAPALLHSLRENGEREVRLVGVDMNERSIGRHLCDVFETVPTGSDPGFAGAVLDICRRENVDVVLPQSSYTLEGLAIEKESFGEIVVVVASIEAIRRANDKAETFAFCDKIGVRVPAWRRVATPAEIEQAGKELGYPEREICMKPLVSSGTRGFRVISASADRRKQLLENRPGVPEALRLEEAADLAGGTGVEWLIMERATGKESTIDGYAEQGEILLGYPKTREAMRAGLAMYFETLDSPELMEAGAKIIRELNFDGFFSVNLVGDCVIEINPRISTVPYQEDFNYPYLALKRAVGELTADELRAYSSRVRPSRRTIRYFDQLGWDE
ncbi:MAG TPA: ATP-grasp domain-containing protein [Gaiellaceae bacterium]